MTPLQAAQAQLDAAQARLDAAQADLDHSLLLLGAVLAFNLALVAGLFAHEAGHALVARRIGLPLRMVRIGRGPVLWRWKLREGWLVVRWWLSGGRVTVLVPFVPARRQFAAFLLGGIGGNAVLLAAAGLVLAAAPDTAWWTAPAALAQGVMIAGAALPLHRVGRRGPVVTDGERLRRLLRGQKPWDAEKAGLGLARRLGILGPFPPASPAMPEIGYQLTRPERASEPWARRDANAALRGVLTRGGLTALEWALVLDDLVIGEVLHPDGLVTPAELDTWSEELLRTVATPHVRVTRAGALCLLGRIGDAEAMLVPWDGSAVRAGHVRVIRLRIDLARLRAGNGAVPR